MFQLRKSKCSKGFESKRFTISVAWVVNCGEKFDDCSCANKWEWISVNSSQIGLVSRRWEKPVGHSKLHLFGCKAYKHKKNIKIINCYTTLNSDILISMMATLQKKKTSWAGSESLWGDKRSLERSGFIMLQFLILSSLRFKCGKSGVCARVRWCLEWQSVI